MKTSFFTLAFLFQLAGFYAMGQCIFEEPKQAALIENGNGSIGALNVGRNGGIAFTVSFIDSTYLDGYVISRDPNYSSFSYIARYDSAGALFAIDAIASVEGAHVSDIKEDASGNFYTFATYTDHIFFGDNGFLQRGNIASQFMLFRYDRDHNLKWIVNSSGNDVGLAHSSADGDERSYDLALDYDGNAYINFSADNKFRLGNFNLDTLSLDHDFMLAKVDSLANVKWVKPMSKNSRASLLFGTGDALYAHGRFRYTLQLDTTNIATAEPQPNDYNNYLAKLNTDGEIIWTRTLKGNLLGTTVADASGTDIHMAGTFIDSMWYDNVNTSLITSLPSQRSVYYYRVDSSNNTIMLKQPLRGINNTSMVVNDIEAMENGDVYLGGYFNDSVVTADNTVYYAPDEQAGFIMKLDSNGDFVWFEVLTGIGFRAALGRIAETARGTILGAASYRDTLYAFTDTFTTYSLNESDFLLFELDQTGEPCWEIVEEDTTVIGIIQHDGVMNEVKVWPNPASVVLQIDLGFAPTETATVRLFNLEGKLMKESLTERQYFQFNTKDLGTGLYILKVYYQGSEQVAKVSIVNHN